MKKGNSLHEQAQSIFKEHLSHLKALLKVRAVKRTAYRIDYLHFTASVSEAALKRNKLKYEEKGVRFLVISSKRPIATIDFHMKKSQLIFSHFTIGKRVKHFHAQLSGIYKKYKIPQTEILYVLKMYVLGRSFIKFQHENEIKFHDITFTNTPTAPLLRKELIKALKLEIHTLEKEERKCIDKKHKNLVDKIDQLNSLKYL